MNNSVSDSDSLALTLEPNDSRRLAILSGQFGAHLKQIEKRLEVQILNRGNAFTLQGSNAESAAQVIEQLYHQTENGSVLTPDEVHLAIQESTMESASAAVEDAKQAVESVSIIRTKKCTVKPRGGNQKSYVSAVRLNDINFGIGPAGTGKTYLAVACGVEALLKDEVERILLVRPAVEAGEKLGFLPGDLAQKVDPYLRPLYDALYEMLGFETVAKFIERNVIEVAPLAYMRGRTLNNSFVILDESQNTTREQMKMFLTRIGFGSTAVITGDPSQIDLPRGQASGLKHAVQVLDGVDGISFTVFGAKDVVRHPIVQRIVEAYDAAEQKAEQQ
ncbi:phosphate starvation-inducible protein PhoH [Alteromonadaceae bacterium Bs31]|nr:phosphate starvation-inducible protein PhoH [Alteromonadaceae bacterium Bs31]